MFERRPSGQSSFICHNSGHAAGKKKRKKRIERERERKKEEDNDEAGKEGDENEGEEEDEEEEGEERRRMRTKQRPRWNAPGPSFPKVIYFVWWPRACAAIQTWQFLPGLI